MTLITNTEVSLEKVCLLLWNLKQGYLFEMQQVHVPDEKALALTMLAQDQQVLLWYQQRNSPSLSFPSSSTKVSEGAEWRFPWAHKQPI